MAIVFTPSANRPFSSQEKLTREIPDCILLSATCSLYVASTEFFNGIDPRNEPNFTPGSHDKRMKF